MTTVIKPMSCTQCGGLVDKNTLICTSCGTRYAIKDGWHTEPDYARPIRIEEIRPDQRRLMMHTQLPAYMFDKAEDPTTLAEFAIKDMAQQMAKNLIPYMQMVSKFEPRFNSYDFYAKVDVLCPDERLNSYKEAFNDLFPRDRIIDCTGE